MVASCQTWVSTGMASCLSNENKQMHAATWRHTKKWLSVQCLCVAGKCGRGGRGLGRNYDRNFPWQSVTFTAVHFAMSQTGWLRACLRRTGRCMQPQRATWKKVASRMVAGEILWKNPRLHLHRQPHQRIALLLMLQKLKWPLSKQSRIWRGEALDLCSYHGVP